MDHVLTEHGLCLTYLCDANAIDELDQDRILDDLTDDAPDGDPLPWLTRYRLADYDHLVLVTDRSCGRYLAFLAAQDGATTREDFLLLETAFVTPVARGQNLMRRMIALAMLRIGGIRAVPSVIVACTRNPICYRIMQETARHFTGAVFFPDPRQRRDQLSHRHAGAAHRARDRSEPSLPGNNRDDARRGDYRRGRGPVSPACPSSAVRQTVRSWLQPADRMLAMLDLRGEDEATILDDARRLYRSR